MRFVDVHRRQIEWVGVLAALGLFWITFAVCAHRVLLAVWP
jgi:hypothetical protein